MRQDKLTTKLQEAISDAHSLAVGNDNQYIEPSHLLLAMLQQGDGSTRSLLERAGVNVARLESSLKTAVDRLPKVTGTGGDIQISRDLMNLLNLTEREAIKRKDQFIASEMVLLALLEDKSEAGRLAREAGLTRSALESTVKAVRGDGTVNSADAESQREALKKYTLDLTERAGSNRSADLHRHADPAGLKAPRYVVGLHFFRTASADSGILKDRKHIAHRRPDTSRHL